MKRIKYAPLWPEEHDTLMFVANMMANGNCAPSLMSGEVQIIESFMRSDYTLYDFILTNLRTSDEEREFILVLLAFALTVGNVE